MEISAVCRNHLCPNTVWLYPLVCLKALKLVNIQRVCYISGPGIIVSFIFAACIVLMVAGCFTEFAARVHCTGSTYLYVYLSLGELPAFLVGFVSLCGELMWLLILFERWTQKEIIKYIFKTSVSNHTIHYFNVVVLVVSYLAYINILFDVFVFLNKLIIPSIVIFLLWTRYLHFLYEYNKFWKGLFHFQFPSCLVLLMLEHGVVTWIHCSMELFQT